MITASSADQPALAFFAQPNLVLVVAQPNTSAPPAAALKIKFSVINHRRLEISGNAWFDETSPHLDELAVRFHDSDNLASASIAVGKQLNPAPTDIDVVTGFFARGLENTVTIEGPAAAKVRMWSADPRNPGYDMIIHPDAALHAQIRKRFEAEVPRYAKMAAAAWWLRGPGFEQLSEGQRAKIVEIRKGIGQAHEPPFTAQQQVDERKRTFGPEMATLTPAQIAKQQVCSNLVRLGDSIESMAEHDVLPADLNPVVDNIVRGDHSVAIFVSPDSGKDFPAEIDRGSATEKRNWVRDNGDYAYFGAGQSWHDPHCLFAPTGPAAPILVEKPLKGDPDDKNMGVLYDTGQVEIVTAGRARQLLMQPATQPAEGPSVVFLFDASGAMLNKMASVKDELARGIVGLRANQSFDIIFYQDGKVETFQPDLVPANAANKRKARDYMDRVTTAGTADPVPAVVDALKLKPQVLYFLSVADSEDFADPPSLRDAIKKYNYRKTKINTILFVADKAEREHLADSEELWKRIATENGGTFRWFEADGIPSIRQTDSVL